LLGRILVKETELREVSWQVLLSPAVSAIPPIHLTRKCSGHTLEHLAHSNAFSDMRAAVDKDTILTLFRADISKLFFSQIWIKQFF
jgi:hypothetical protein